MKPVKFLTFISLFTVLAACGSDTGPAPEPAQDWIEIPLSENTWWPGTREYRSGTYEIVLDGFAALEFKLAMNTGDFIVYEWDANLSDPTMLLAEFHGHTERVGEEPGTVMFYSRHTNAEESGTLLAPVDGIHGWYLKNNGLDTIVVTLNVAGFYDEVP